MGIFKLIRSLLLLPINLITMPFRMWVNSMITMIGCGLAVVVVVVLVVIFVVLD